MASTAEKEGDELNNKVATVSELAHVLQIFDAQTFEQAGNMLSELKSIQKRIEAEEDRVTDPLRQALEAERSRWRPMKLAIKTAIDSLKGSVTAYNAQILAEQRLASEKLSTGQIDLSKALSTTQVPVSSSIRMTKRKQFRITNLTKVPRKYLILDEKAVREAMKNDIKIAGIEYFIEETPTITPI